MNEGRDLENGLDQVARDDVGRSTLGHENARLDHGDLVAERHRVTEVMEGSDAAGAQATKQVQEVKLMANVSASDISRRSPSPLDASTSEAC